MGRDGAEVLHVSVPSSSLSIFSPKDVLEYQ